MIREATAIDAAAIARVQVDSWDAVYRGLMPDAVIDSFTVERRTDQWQRFFGSTLPGRALLVAEHEGIVGMITIGPARDEPADTGEVYALYVAPDHWDHGHGHELITGAVAWMSDAGHTSAVLWVLDSNDRARRFYEATGWATDGHARVEVFPEGSLNEVRYRRDVP